MQNFINSYFFLINKSSQTQNFIPKTKFCGSTNTETLILEATQTLIPNAKGHKLKGVNLSLGGPTKNVTPQIFKLIQLQNNIGLT